MSNFICVACGTQFEDSGDAPPGRCPICDDNRQYVPPEGQRWTTMDELRVGHHNEFKRKEDRLTGIGTTPNFAIGQRALLVQSPAGNVLWDCITLLDEFTERLVTDLGGIAAIAISHPHYYSAMAEWSAAFSAPVYIHAKDRQWVMRTSPSIVHWTGDELELHDGMRLVNPGGHFDGAAMLHVPFLAGGRGALLTGDTIQVIPDRRFVSFMYSYPNLVPLSPAGVKRIAGSIAGLEFDRIYGAWWDRVIPIDAKQAIVRSADRYIEAIGGA